MRAVRVYVMYLLTICVWWCNFAQVYGNGERHVHRHCHPHPQRDPKQQSLGQCDLIPVTDVHPLGDVVYHPVALALPLRVSSGEQIGAVA
jgi:hypothetical protein